MCCRKVKRHLTHHQGKKHNNDYLHVFSFPSNRILEAIENVVEDVPISNASERVVIAQKSFAVSVQQVDIEEFSKSGQTFSVNLPDFTQQNISSDDISFERTSASPPTGSIQLPSNLLSSLPDNLSNASRITHAVFVTDSLFLRRGFSYKRVSSIIISASVVGIETLRGLRPPVNLGFKLTVRIIMTDAFVIIMLLFRLIMDHFLDVISGINP